MSKHSIANFCESLHPIPSPIEWIIESLPLASANASTELHAFFDVFSAICIRFHYFFAILIYSYDQLNTIHIFSSALLESGYHTWNLNEKKTAESGEDEIEVLRSTVDTRAQKKCNENKLFFLFL